MNILTKLKSLASTAGEFLGIRAGKKSRVRERKVIIVKVGDVVRVRLADYSRRAIRITQAEKDEQTGKTWLTGVGVTRCDGGDPWRPTRRNDWFIFEPTQVIDLLT